MPHEQRAIDGDWFVERLNASGKNQSDLAEYLGLHRSGVSIMLSGRRTIDQYEILKIARFIGADIGEVVLRACGQSVGKRVARPKAALDIAAQSDDLILKDAGGGKAALRLESILPWPVALEVLRLVKGEVHSKP